MGYKIPNIKGPRYRKTRLNILEYSRLKKFKELNPIYKNIKNSKLKKIIKLFNEKIWANVIECRDGVELPESLGYIFIATCNSNNPKNINYNLSQIYNKPLLNRNWETDGHIAKIVYTNFSVKYKFKNRDLWKFEACRNFKRTLSKHYPQNWTKYIVLNKDISISRIINQKYNEYNRRSDR